MTDNNIPKDLQILWDELTQSDEVRRKRIRKRRFDERAKQYAQPNIDAETYDDSDVYHLLTFHLGDERYGIDVDAVMAVRPLESMTRIPNVPSFYRGIINVRGQIITVLDVRLFFGLDVSSANKNEVIIIEAYNLTLALLADHIEEIYRISRTTVQAVDMPYIIGVTPEQLAIIDLHTLLTDDRLIIGGDKL
ncbi:MAG: chemotaxis protein CheW [Chloroflexota bacterium]